MAVNKKKKNNYKKYNKKIFNNNKSKNNYSNRKNNSNNKKNTFNKNGYNNGSNKYNRNKYNEKNNNYVNKRNIENLDAVINGDSKKIDGIEQINNTICNDISLDKDNVENLDENDVNEFNNKEILDDNDISCDKLNNNREEDARLSDSVINEDNTNIDGNSNIKKKIIKVLVLFIFIVILGVMVLFFPRFRLNGDSEIVISYKDNYVESGYIVSVLDKDISDEVEIVSNLEDGIVGQYRIEYYLDKFGIRFKKYRNVSIVDNIEPIINVDSDIINVCPNHEIKDIEYNAIDEYDGDITDKVEKIFNDNDVILKVMDSSGNIGIKNLKVERVDDIKPIIKLRGDSVMFINYGSKYVEPGYSVSDNCSSNLDSKVIVSGSVGSDIGTYNITYSVVDDSGNKGSVTRRVIVGNKINDNGIVSDGSIYLTFDDGPNEGTTNKILDILQDEGVKATFFVTMNGPDYLIKRMYDEGHTVALHTASHNYSYIYSSIDNYYSDLNKIGDRVKRITGNDSKIIRFPGGSSNTISCSYKKGIMTELTNLVLNDGYRYFDWNVDAMDASSARTSSDVYYNVVSNLNGNRSNVILMHDIKSITVGALRNIIKYGKDSGYSFKKIDMNTKMVRHSVSN